jgi:hypothetical protein
MDRKEERQWILSDYIHINLKIYPVPLTITVTSGI